MKHPSLVAALLVSIALAGCSSQSPTAPASAPVVGGELAARPSELSARPSSAAPGVYQLSFLHLGQPVQSLPVGQELSLKALVLNATTGLPATDGTVTFQYCSRGGRKTDITNVDEAPKVECDQGAARWTTVVSVSIFEKLEGQAFGAFPVVRIPRTIGFRFLFRPGKSGIDAGESAHLDFTWEPLS
jgi:hypothetical protein